MKIREITCKRCNTNFETDDYRRKFCGKSCSAAYNNKFRKKNKVFTCLACNKENNHSDRVIRKYCNRECQKQYFVQLKLESDTFSHISAKRYLLGIDPSCSICKLESIWQDKPLVLVLDHIDGNSENGSLSNVRLVCPNCDSQLPTFKSRNKGNGRHARRERYKNGQSY